MIPTSEQSMGEDVETEQHSSGNQGTKDVEIEKNSSENQCLDDNIEGFETSPRHVAYGLDTDDVAQKYYIIETIRKSGLKEVTDNKSHFEGSRSLGGEHQDLRLSLDRLNEAAQKKTSVVRGLSIIYVGPKWMDMDWE